MSRLRAITLLLAATALLAAGCGSDDGGDGAPDGAAMTEDFEALSIEAYEAEGKDRDKDFAQGLLLNDCFAIDQEGLDALGAALGASDLKVQKPVLLSGAPGDEETVNCSLTDGDESPAALVAGTTPLDADGLRELLNRAGDFEDLEGDASGLNSADVVATDDGGIQRYGWVSDDFFVGVTGPSEGLKDGVGFETLSVAVEQVARTLESG